MEMPTTMTRKYEVYKAAETEKQLFEMLITKHLDFVHFFIDACEDETWCDAHESFVKSSLKWLTYTLYHGTLSIDLAKMAAKAIRRHFQYLEHCLPKDITCLLKDETRVINSFLFQTASDYWFHQIRSRCADKGVFELKLFEVEGFEFKYAEEYAYTGEVQQLWNLVESEILKVLLYARFCELDWIVLAAEKMLARYIDGNNFLEYLALADERSFDLIKQSCCECYNGLQNFVILTSLGDRFLSAELNASTETSLEQFAKIQNYVTHFISGPATIEDPAAIEMLNKCPRLISVDLGKTRAFSEFPLQLTDLKELVLAGCLWLRDMHLKKICQSFSKLQKLDLSSCSHITPAGWGELTHLSRLTSLNLARNENLNDLQFNLILASARRLHELILNECRNLTHASFHAIAASRQRFVTLGLARTALTNAALMEIISKMPSLSYLDLTRCPNLTEEGVLDALKISYNLAEVNISHLGLPSGAIEAIKKLKPSLKVITID